MSMMRSIVYGSIITAALAASPALAEVQLSIYGGANTNFDSKVKTEKGAVSDSRTVSWDGKPWQMPPYWGARATYWLPEKSPWGVALDYTHQKAYADIDFGADPVYDHLEFTDGNNIVTLNAMYRFQNPSSKWGYYVGGGPGLAFPSVEVTLDGVAEKTKEYQITGFAAQALAGAQYKFTDHIAGFTEAKLTYTQNNGDLEGGGTVKTHLWSPNLIAGLSYSF
jgi:lipid A oxidase